MMLNVARLLAAITLVICFALISGCDSGGSTGPEPGPGENDELTFDYCEVVEVTNQMHVRWAANRATRGDFRYGQTDYVQIKSDNELALEHDVLLIGLEFDRAYIYRLTITDAAGMTADCEGDFNSPLKATPEPVITNLEFTNITENSAEVSWITDELATTILYYGAGTAADSMVVSSFDYEHSVTLTGLTAATSYTVRPEAIDLDGLRGVGIETAFDTKALLMLWFDDLSVALGETSEVAIHLDGAEDLGALQYQLQFEDTIGAHSGNGAIRILDLRAGPFTSSDMAPLFFQDIRNSNRFVSNEMSWVIEYDGNERIGTVADGGGVVAILQFKGTRAGDLPSEFDPDDSFGLDMFSNMRACSLRTGTITVTQ